MKNARKTAFELLYGILKEGAYSNLALDKSLAGLDEKDRAFVSALVYGVIERKLTLEYLINRHLSSKAKPKVMILLYMGAYQLYFTDKIPAPVAIHTTVELAGETGLGYYKKLINAVLRNLDSNRVDIESLEDWSIRFSCPTPLVQMWKKAYGEENTLAILKTINGRPPVFAVPNVNVLDAEELQYELLNEGIQCDVNGDIVEILSGIDISNCKTFQNGLFHIEDMSSYRCAMALDAKPGDVVLDICAAPGGKAFTIAECMHDKGIAYAFDLHEHRVKLIESGAQRLGITNLKAAVNDATVFNQDMPVADKILCDVPCSGFGIMRRKPEIRYKDLDSIKELFDIQYTILSVSSRYLKLGGRMVYSTCTLNKKENEKIVQRFLEEHTDFTLVEEKTVFPAPHGGDGFYYAVLVRTL